MDGKQYPVTRTDAEWRKLLTPEQFHIMREHGTERPGSCALNHEKRAGLFSCAGCEQPLFVSKRKFESGTVLIERTKLRRWLSQRGFDYKTFIREFDEEQIIATPKSQKAYFGKDVGIKIPQCYVVGINLNHPRLQGVLDDAEQSVDNLTYGQVKAV